MEPVHNREDDLEPRARVPPSDDDGGRGPWLDHPGAQPKVTWLEVLIAAVAFGALALWRMSDAFIRPGWSVSAPWGDGIGGMGLIFDQAHRFLHEGFKAKFLEVYRTPDIGAGFHAPFVTTTFWRAQYWTLAHFLSIDNIYDFLCWCGFALNGLCSYLVGREIRFGRTTAGLLGIAVVSLEFFDTRVTGHLHMTLFFYQLMACWLVLRAAKHPTAARMILAGAGSWLAFVGNEYNGYFSFFFCAVLFSSYRMFERRASPRALVGGLVAASLTFLALMIVSYPRLTLGRVLARWGLMERTPAFSYSDADFQAYSLAHPINLFRPSLTWLSRALPPFPADTSEFTFRLGIVVPVLVAGLLIALIVLSLRHLSLERKRALETCTAWGAAALVLFLFSLAPEYALSLVPLTRRIAPMFRVGVRALLFVDFAVLVMAGLLLDHFVRTELGLSPGWTRRSLSARRIAVSLILLAVFCIGVEDIRPAHAGVFSKIPVAAVPHEVIYDRLAGLPEGMVLELPFHFAPTDNPETDYQYVANRMFHYKPVLNYMRDDRVQCQAMQFATEVNHPHKGTAALLRQLGVRYLVVHTSGDDRYDLRPYTTDPELAQLSRDGSVALLEVKSAARWDTARFLAHYGRCAFDGGLLPTTVQSDAVFDPVRRITDRVARFSSLPGGRFVTYGPYVSLDRGQYEVTYEIRAAVEKTDPHSRVMIVDVFGQPGGIVAEAEIARDQLADGAFHAVTLPFVLTEPTVTQFRVRAYAPGILVVGEIGLRTLKANP